jgi:hypothetical protein
MSTSQLDLQAYQEYWKRLTFEHDLINRRITWLLSSQTILFAAYGITFTLSAAKLIGIFPSVIAWSGMIMSILILSGILASLRAKHAVWRDYQNSYDSSQEWGVRTRLTWAGLVPDVCLPLLFAIAWLVVLVS